LITYIGFMTPELEAHPPRYPIDALGRIPQEPGIAEFYDAAEQAVFITYSLKDLQEKVKKCLYKQEAAYFCFVRYPQNCTYQKLQPHLKARIETKQPRRNKRFNPHYNATKPTIKSLQAKIEQMQVEADIKEQKNIAETQALHKKIDELLKLVTAFIMPNSPNKPRKQKASAPKARQDSSYRLHAVGDSLLWTGQEEQATNIASRESVKPSNPEKLLPVVVSVTLPAIAAPKVKKQPEVEPSLYRKALSVFRLIRWGL
jgi:hypothetical protein